MKNLKLTGFTAMPLLFMATTCTSAPNPGLIPPINGGDGDGDKDDTTTDTIPECPNLVYIMTDQQSHYMISEIAKNLGNEPYAGNPYVKTPNLDKLVKKGYAFANCYAAHPVSGPSRFALLTGESPNKYGAWGNTSPKGANGEKVKAMVGERSMGQLFKKAGYKTFYGGKRHLAWANGVDANVNGIPTHYGFDSLLTPNDRDELAAKAVQFFAEYQEPEPFLLFLSFMNPHDICSSPQLFNGTALTTAYDDLYSEKYMSSLSNQNLMDWRASFLAIPGNDKDAKAFTDDTYASLPANMAQTDIFTADMSTTTQAKYGLDAAGLKKWRAHMWLYYGLMEQVDALLGQVLDALEASDFSGNTMIVFTSDHGEMGGSHGVVGKNVPYQECQRVPLVFAGPGIKKGVLDKTTIACNGWDVLPTMLGYAGVGIPEELLGVSLVETITKGTAPNRRYIYLETVNSYGIFDGRYKYTRFTTNAGGGPFTPNVTDKAMLLVDQVADPGELTNLAYNHPEHAAKLAELQAALAAEMALREVSF